MSNTYLVTGAQGCIGAWVVKLLVERGDRAVVLDLSDDNSRLAQIAGSEVIAEVEYQSGDITDFATVSRVLEESGAQRIIHLAGLQVPFCKADPALGAAVNVLGTVHILEAAKRQGIERVAYASSAAVYGPDAPERVGEDVACHPTTHYGVYKCANEGSARIYFQDDGLTSVGLRPLTVYGVARDQGLTSDITKAMKAAVVGRPFDIRFTGATDVIHARDAAWAFIIAADTAPPGAHVFNLHGDRCEIAEIIDLIHAQGVSDCIGMTGVPLPIPPEMVDESIREVLGDLPRTALADGVRETMDAFRALDKAGRLSVRELDV